MHVCGVGEWVVWEGNSEVNACLKVHAVFCVSENFNDWDFALSIVWCNLLHWLGKKLKICGFYNFLSSKELKSKTTQNLVDWTQTMYIETAWSKYYGSCLDDFLMWIPYHYMIRTQSWHALNNHHAIFKSAGMTQTSVALSTTLLSASTPSITLAPPSSINLQFLSPFSDTSFTTSSLIPVDLSSKMPHQLSTTSLLLRTVTYVSHVTPTCCISISSEDGTSHIYVLVTILSAVLALFFSAVTVVLLILSSRCRGKYNTV